MWLLHNGVTMEMIFLIDYVVVLRFQVGGEAIKLITFEKQRKYAEGRLENSFNEEMETLLHY